MSQSPAAAADGDPEVVLRRPVVADGAALWALAKATEVLDVNSPYAYLLWCRDFTATSIVADRNGVVGFVTGYRRPDEPGTLVVWQVAVAASQRGQGLAGRMLDALVPAAGADGAATCLETTITDDNVASRRLFEAFARRHGADVERSTLFDRAVFPDRPDGAAAHEPEILHRIAPLTR